MFVSNISLTDNGKNYYGSYVQDDWKVSPKLTVNLGLRWDFFGLVYEHHGSTGQLRSEWASDGQPVVPDPVGNQRLPTFRTSFNTLLAKDGIGLDIGNKYGKGLGNSQKANFAPRVGFAYQVTNKLVARGGFGIFYNGFENRGFSPNLGENYPFQFNFQFALGKRQYSDYVRRLHQSVRDSDRQRDPGDRFHLHSARSDAGQRQRSGIAWHSV